MTGAVLWEAAQRLVGVPYQHMGRNRHGVDCAGVILLPAWELNLTTFQPATYSPGGDARYLLGCLYLECECVPEPAAGDIALFRLGRLPGHLAYLDGRGLMVHLNTAARIVRLSRIDEDWESRLLSVWRWKALVREERAC